MSHETELFYVCTPSEPQSPTVPVEFLPVGEFLADEAACRQLWNLVSTQFRTRSKFLAVWAGVQFVAVNRDDAGEVAGFLLVNAPVNWQIDYVVVRPDARGRGIAGALVAATLDQAYRRGVPYVTLTSKPALRPLYEACGFTVVAEKPASLASSSHS
jgi:GNAT superfamily N-acetyltransferase